MPRVLISKKSQYELCLSAKNKLGVSWNILASDLKVSPRAFRNWYSCDRLLPEDIYIRLAAITGYNMTQKSILPDNWGKVKGGISFVAKYGKYFGTSAGRSKGGANSANKFVQPVYSKELAEFIGIMLGDGGVARGQISITLGYSTDKEYIPFIRKLIYKLFSVRGSTYRSLNRDAIRIQVSGVNLVKILLNLGLVQGDKIKQQFDIPSWIQGNKDYIKACIRGMIDTDGCVHRKVRRESSRVEYRSIGITFCSASKPLQLSMIRLFNLLEYKVAISGRIIYLCGKEQVKRYVNEIGFSNPKHLNRYKKFLLDYGWIKFQPENCLYPNTTI